MDLNLFAHFSRNFVFNAHFNCINFKCKKSSKHKHSDILLAINLIKITVIRLLMANYWCLLHFRYLIYNKFVGLLLQMSFKAAVESVSYKSDSTDPSHDLCFRESLKLKQLRKKILAIVWARCQDYKNIFFFVTSCRGKVS